MALLHFLGGELVTALGRLAPAQVLGPWPGRRPHECRPAARFTVAYYGEDHAHAHAELCLLLDGDCHFSFAGKRVRLRPGDLVVCPPACPHAETYRRPGAGYRLVWWILRTDEPVVITTRYRRNRGFELTHRVALTALPAEARERLGWLRTTAAAGRPPECERLREALLTLTLALFRRALQPARRPLETRTVLVERAAAFVRANARRPLALGEVARAARVSPNYLTALFRATMGRPLGHFIMEERIAEARRLLARREAGVKETAFALGFADPFTFSRAFKRVTGQSPRAWQAAQRG